MRTTEGKASQKLEVWHAGEKALQQEVGLAARMEQIGQRVIRDFMPDQHREFYAQLPFIVAGSTDRQDDAWATLLASAPGFVASPTPRDLEIAVRLDPSDPASAGLYTGQSIGLLGIELHSRRRNRVNGVIRATENDVLSVEVEQSFGNCPQYITRRDMRFVRDPRMKFVGARYEGTALDQAAREMIETADTFFVASYADREGRRQLDVSHRGGKAGFVRVNDDGTLWIPDYSGNFFFATLGNILLNGRAGLVFSDFASGDLLQLTGDARVILDSAQIADFQQAERLWSFRPRRVVRRPAALALRGSTLRASFDQREV